MMAHEFFAFRRMDRMYHRATLRFAKNVYDQVEMEHQASLTHKLDRNRPFLVISISGDLFLRGQICRVVGVLIALARGLIDEDFVDCVFDEAYPIWSRRSKLRYLQCTPLKPITHSGRARSRKHCHHEYATNLKKAGMTLILYLE